MVLISSYLIADDDASSTLSSRTSSMRINTSDMGNYLAEDRESDGELVLSSNGAIAYIYLIVYHQNRHNIRCLSLVWYC